MAGRCCRALVFAALAAFVAQVEFGQSILTVAGGASTD